MRRLAALAAPALLSAALAVPAAAQDLASMAGETNMAALNDGRPIRGRLEGGTPAGRVAGPALLSRADLDYLADRIGQAVTGARSPGNETLQLVVDGKVLAEAVRKHNRGLK